MSRKIVVTPSNERIKKSAAELKVRRGLAEWVVRNVSIRLLAIRELPVGWMSQKLNFPAKPYIPDRLPPAEVENCKFMLPTADKTHGFYMELARRGNSFDPRGYEFKAKPWKALTASA